MGWGKFKPEFTEAMINVLNPIQEKYKELMNDQEELKRVKDALGFYSN